MDISYNDDSLPQVIISPEVVAASVGTFLELTDTPASYAGSGGYCLKVNAGGTAVEFAACVGGGDFSFSDFQDSFNLNVSGLEYNFNQSDLDLVYAKIGTEGNTSWNEIYADNLYVVKTGDTMAGNLNMGGYQLTAVGALVMEGLISSYSIIPVTDNLYSLGNSTNKFKELFVGDVNAENVNSNYANITNINSTNVNSNMVESNTVNSTQLNSENLSVGGSQVYVKDGTTFYKATVWVMNMNNQEEG